MKKKKILYFLQVPWDWIKQRPQFLAEELAAYFDVTVINITLPGKVAKSDINGLKIVNIYRLPLERYSIIAYISKLFQKIQQVFIREKSDYVWLSSPSQIKVARYYKGKAKIIYDCMDDMLAFPMSQKKVELIRDREKKLYELSDFVFTSADYLKNKLYKRYGQRSVCVVNNAITSKLLEKKDFGNIYQTDYYTKDFFNVTYIGTISEWFDFDLLLYILKNCPSVCFYLFGPTRVEIPPNHRIKYCGSIEHNKISAVMAGSDTLIMPFKVTELIKSVNPVKLYEYIMSGKPCLAPEYGESLPFKDYVMLYKDRQHFLSLLYEAMEGKRVKSEEERMLFLKNNTWSERARVIYQNLESE